MSQQSRDEHPTVVMGSAAPPAPAGVSKPRGNRPLILGTVGGCLILLLLLACGGVAGWYFITHNQAVQLALTQSANTPVGPTAAATTAPVATSAPTEATQPTESASATLAATEAAQPTGPAATTPAPTAAAATAEPTTAPGSPAAPLLAFASNRSGSIDIYVLDVSHPETVTNLTDGSAAYDSFPAWSPDGKQIAFASDRTKHLEIYVMNAGGGPAQQLTHDKNQDYLPSWSPDGKQIAYTSKIRGNLDVYVMNADGSNPKLLTNNPADDDAPQWSPDGKLILFRSTRDANNLPGTAGIFVMNADGSNAHRLIASGQWATWTPDGQQVIFSGKTTAKGTFQIYRMNPDGSGIVQLTKDASSQLAPAVSPDGKLIAFVSDRGGYKNVFVMQADGSHEVQLTTVATENNLPNWRPAQ